MAIAKRDPVEAEQAMRAHIRNVEYRIERVAFGK
jgi:DNA-binding GntR family transcriptional regulator